MIEEWDAWCWGSGTDKFAQVITESQILGIFLREILDYSYHCPAQYLAAEMVAAKYMASVEKLQRMKAQGAFTNVASKYYLSTRQFKNSVETLWKILGKSRTKVRPSLPTNWGSTAVDGQNDQGYLPRGLLNRIIHLQTGPSLCWQTADITPLT